ncbi:MAG: HAMP domain-containing histidine kinase [Burkholderiaceae bacterium]|nr:HAMP domain-containing histidine kinase [Burkholderiaceae bacterium]
MKPTSLAGALTRALLPWIGLLWLCTSLAVGWYMQHELEEQLDAGLMESAERLLDLAAHDARNHQRPSERDGTLFRTEVPHHNASDLPHDILVYQVLNPQGELLLRSADAPMTALPVPPQTGFHNTSTLRIYTLVHPVLPMLIHVGDPLMHRRVARNQTLVWLIVPLLAVLPLMAWLVRFVTQRALAPAGQLGRDIQRRDGKNLQPLQTKRLPQELQTIADSTNHLLRRLADALDTERALAANAAHELRTPLATVRLRLQKVWDGAAREGKDQEDIRYALDALERLNRRCEKLLQLSRAESGAAQSRDRVNLVALAAAVAQEFWADPAVLSRLQLVVPESEDVWVRADFDALAIVLRNLLENAVRYAPAGAIVLEVAVPNILRVRDHGPGIAPECLQELQVRHHRGSGLVTEPLADVGYGLGLSIVRMILQRQGGDLTLTSPPIGQTHGLDAVCTLPVFTKD